jgi:tetratricopeptide (TPR) repeat protein
VEIQAGLARTQLEHLPLAAGKSYSWVEAYGAMQADPQRLHGQWEEAQNAVTEFLGDTWEEELRKLKILRSLDGGMIHTGSGWGCLEQMRRTADGENKLSPTYEFPESSLSSQQLPWVALLQNGKLAAVDPMASPAGYLVDEGWKNRLEAAEGHNWFSLMHLGLMRYTAGDLQGAQTAFEESLALAESPWVLRNLAMLHGNELGDFPKAMAYMERCLEVKNDNRWLWIDMAVLCLKAKQEDRWLALYDTVPGEIQTEGRLKLYTAIALTRLDRLEEATGYLNHDLVVPDIKEDENLITEAWFSLYGKILSKETGITDGQQLKALVEEKYPLEELDFRMH